MFFIICIISKFSKLKTMFQNINGYGFGVWLLVENDELNSIMNHPTHITIMCNMTEDDAVKLYRNLSEICGENHIALCNNLCERFDETGYSKDEPFKHCSGYYCMVEMWNIISHFCEKRLKYDSSFGSFSKKPHITYCYSDDFQKTQFLNLKERKYLNCKLVVADIRADNPAKWTYT